MTRPDSFPRFLDEWREVNGSDFTPTSYLGKPGTLPIVIAAQWLYAPDFVEYRGGIFRTELPAGLSTKTRETLDGWFEAYDGNIQKVEQVGNWLTLWAFS